jgi:rhomboid protease GluP
VSIARAPVTIALLAACWIVFIIDFWVLGGGQNGPLTVAGAIFPDAVSAGQYYRLITYGFLHGGVLHIALNSYALAQAGMVVENVYGSARFAAIYAAGLIAGGIAAYVTTLHTQEYTLGASGAIMGLFGAMAALGLKIPRLRQTLLGWAAFPIIATLAYGFMNPGISNAGHIGGVIAGGIAGFVLGPTGLRAHPEEL